MKVQSMLSSNGTAVPNQFVVTNNGSTYFQSYDSIIVVKTESGSIVLDSKHWDHSKTTGKYRNIFLGETKKETEKKIKDGIYKLADLNTVA